MKIQIVSDLHLEFSDYNWSFEKADVIVFAGDTHIGTKGIEWVLSKVKNKPVIYILGNHEYYKNSYPKLIFKVKNKTQNTNIHFLENNSVEIDGVRFHGATLWTDFELFGNPMVAGVEAQLHMNDYKKIRRDPQYSKIRSVDIYKIHKLSMQWLEISLLESSSKYNVVITHHAPSKKSLLKEFENDLLSAAYTSDLEPFILVHKPDLWVHGHLHHSNDYMIGDTRILSNPRGYFDEPNKDFIPELIVELGKKKWIDSLKNKISTPKS